MRDDFFDFEPKFKLFIVGNHKPRLDNVDEPGGHSIAARRNLGFRCNGPFSLPKRFGRAGAGNFKKNPKNPEARVGGVRRLTVLAADL